MSEWIKREDREPPRYATPPVEVFIPKEATGHSVDRIIITSEPPCWPEATHWRTHVPPPRTVKIEISEEDALFIRDKWKFDWCGDLANKLSWACEKAMGAKR